MDTLVALGASAAFGYSTAALFAMTDAQLTAALRRQCPSWTNSTSNPPL